MAIDSDKDGNFSFMNLERLKSEAKGYSVELEDSALKKLDTYAQVLVEWNKVMNLTAIVEMDEMLVKHFLDSITIIPFLERYRRERALEKIELIDVGTGAGFPGLVVAICCPWVTATLLDSLNKRIKFLEEVKRVCCVDNVTLIHSRAEDGGLCPDLREKFDIATARAVARLSVLSEYCLPFIKVGGQFIAMKGPVGKEEVASAKKAIRELGGAVGARSINEFYIESGNNNEDNLERNIVIIDKKTETPIKYPRNPAIIKKQPL